VQGLILRLGKSAGTKHTFKPLVIYTEKCFFIDIENEKIIQSFQNMNNRREQLLMLQIFIYSAPIFRNFRSVNVYCILLVSKVVFPSSLYFFSHLCFIRKITILIFLKRSNS